MTTIAFLGTGLMGAPMAARLAAAGHRVVAWNRTVSKVTSLIHAGVVAAARADVAVTASPAKAAGVPGVAAAANPIEMVGEAGVVAAASPAEAVAEAEFICLALSDAAAVEIVLFGERGVAEAGKPTKLLIDFSTLDPATTRSFAARLQQRCGVRWIDSPVSGGVAGAAAGKLIAFCGGENDDIARALPVLSPLTTRVNHLGPLGAGQAAKLCNQLIVASNVLAIAEALSLAKTFGLDIRKIPTALAGGFADSLPLQIFGPRMAAGITTPKLGEISLMLKDIEAVVNAANPGPLTNTVHALYRRAQELKFGNEDLAALMRLYEQH